LVSCASSLFERVWGFFAMIKHSSFAGIAPPISQGAVHAACLFSLAMHEVRERGGFYALSITPER